MGRDAQTVNLYVREPVHVHLHLDGSEIPLRLDMGNLPGNTQIAEILSALAALTEGVERMSGELDSLKSEVERNTSVDQSAIALLEGLKKQLDDAGTDPQKLQDLKDQLAASSDALANAVAANTPADPNAVDPGNPSQAPSGDQPQVNPL